MSAIVIHTTPIPPHLIQQEHGRHESAQDASETTPLLTTRSILPKQKDRSAPLKEILSTPRFIIICTGIFSGNFIFAFQSTAIPTLAPNISSEFNHAELAAYLGSIFSLASAAGKAPSSPLRRHAKKSHTRLWRSDGFAGKSVCDVHCLSLFRSWGGILRLVWEHLDFDRCKSFCWGASSSHCPYLVSKSSSLTESGPCGLYIKYYWILILVGRRGFVDSFQCHCY